MGNLNNPVNSCLCLHPTHVPFFSSPIFHGCVNERLADRTPSPTFSTSDSEITELADERQSEMEDFMDDEAFVDDTSSDAGTEEGSDIFSDGQDPFYDRSPWFILVGRLVVATAEKPEKWGLEREWMTKRNGDCCVAQCAAVNDLKII